PHQPRSPLVPYTTLFRSQAKCRAAAKGRGSTAGNRRPVVRATGYSATRQSPHAEPMIDGQAPRPIDSDYQHQRAPQIVVLEAGEIGRASCRERGASWGGA